MAVSYHTSRTADGNLCITFDVHSRDETFDAVVAYLKRDHGARVLKRIGDRIDTRYWDMRVAGQLVTLHMNWCLFGLMSGGPTAEETVRMLAGPIAAFLGDRQGGDARPP